jgi:MFS transporter, FSR family, fosmidomycin resistance protein
MIASSLRLRRAALFVVALLLIEFLDEFVFGAREAAWPVIRSDLHLTYEQVGLLLSVPGLLSVLIEPALGILGDVWKRRIVILAGGVLFTGSLVFMATSGSFIMLLLATIFLFPASGAFVGLSQSTLMDVDPTRHEQNMARWTFAGSVGVVVGAAALGAAVGLNVGWRGLFLGIAGLSLVLVLLVRRVPFGEPASDVDEPSVSLATALKSGVLDALQAIRRRDVLRWLVLLEAADLLQDVLYGFLALYFVDVTGASIEQATLLVAVWTGISFIGDLLVIPLLERVQGLRYVWMSALVAAILFPAFLLIPGWLPKLVCVGLLGLTKSGWYPVLQGNLYSSMPGQSGTVFALGSVSSLWHSLIPLAIGIVAERFGLGIAFWLLMLGPITLLIGLPRQSRDRG